MFLIDRRGFLIKLDGKSNLHNSKIKSWGRGSTV